MSGLWVPRGFQPPLPGVSRVTEATTRAHLALALVHQHGDNGATDLVSGVRASTVANASTANGWTFSSTAPMLTVPSPISTWTGARLTFAISFTAHAFLATNALLFNISGAAATNNGIRIGVINAAILVTLGSVGESAFFTAQLPEGTRARFVATFRVGTGWNLWLRPGEDAAVQTATYSIASTPGGAPSFSAISSSFSSSTQYFRGAIDAAVIATRLWDDAEVRSWIAQPYDILTR